MHCICMLQGSYTPSANIGTARSPAGHGSPWVNKSPAISVPIHAVPPFDSCSLNPLRIAMSLWDIIVVGGGIAGSVVSSRLHGLDPTLKILLIEGGPNTHLVEGIEWTNMDAAIGGPYDWGVCRLFFLGNVQAPLILGSTVLVCSSNPARQPLHHFSCRQRSGWWLNYQWG